MTLSSPLAAQHEQAGATFTEFAGWRMPVRYDSDLAEHHAVRQRAGLFDLSHMGELEVHGADAGRFLDHALVGHLSVLAPGRARYTMLCAPDGGVLDDLVVYRLEDERFLIVANAANTPTVLRELRERAAGFEVDLIDVGTRTALLALQGPAAAGVLGGLLTGGIGDGDEGDGGAQGLAALPYYAAAPAVVAGHPVLLARTGYTGEDGFELYTDAEVAPELWERLLDAGSGAGVVPCGLAARDTLRLEAGMPLYGQELGADRTPYEAGLGRIVKLDKPGGFIGRDALAARAARVEAQDADGADADGGGGGERLVGLLATGRRAPRPGYHVLDAQGMPVGRVTSGALSPTLAVPIAMAYVPVGYDEPGRHLAVDVRGTALQVEVTKLPFYRRAG